MEPEKKGYINGIYYQIYGRGNPTLLLLHGNGEDFHAFQNQIASFSEKYTVLTMDSRGHGKSAFGDQKLTISQIAEDAILILSTLGIENAAVVGFSDGANVALQMAIRYPDRVRAMVCAGANCNPSGVKLGAQMPVVLLYLLYRVFAVFSKNAEKHASVLSLMVNEPDFTPQMLQRIRCPVLLMAGDNDLIKDAHTRKIASDIPNAKLSILRNCNHFVFLKKPEEAGGAVLDFLEEIG